MSFRPLVLASLSLSVAALAQQPFDFATWLQQRYPVAARANVADAIAGAQSHGLLRSPSDLAALKRAFHAFREAKTRGGAGRPVLLDAPPGPSLVQAVDNIVPEVEFNDGPEFATPLLVAACGRGDNSVANDIDLYSFVSTGEFVTIEVQPRGATPIVDSMLGIKNEAGQMIAFSEDISASNFLSRTSVYLPAGLYQAEVGPWDSTGGGSYDLVFQRDTAALTPLVAGTNNGTTTVPGTGPQTVWTFTLPTDSTVTLGVFGSGTSDLHLALQLADGRMWFLNDDATGAGTDPGADLDLPAGNYTVHISDLTGAVVPYSINYTATPTNLADLCGAGVQTGGITGPESRRLYRLTNAALGDIDLQTAGGSTPIGDTILYVFDVDMNYLCDVDDANMANPNDYYSRLQIGLPPGLYYVAVRGYLNSAGDYTLTTTCGLPFPTPGTVGYGRTNVPVAGGGRVSLSTIDVCSGNSVRLDSTGGLAATLYNVMTSTGRSLGVMEWSQDVARIGPGGRARSRPTVGFLPAGTHYVLTWYRFEQSSTTMFLDVLPSLGCEAGQLRSHGKAGDVAFLFGEFTPSPGVSLAAFGVDGLFCLPIPSALLVGIGVYPANGTVSWFACPATTFGAYVQHGDVFAVPQGALIGSFRDRRRI